MHISPTPFPKRQHFCLLGLGIPKQTFDNSNTVPQFPYFVIPLQVFETMEAAVAARDRQAARDKRLELVIAPVGKPLPLSVRNAEDTEYMNPEEDKYMKQFNANQEAQRKFLEQKRDESRRKAIVASAVSSDNVVENKTSENPTYQSKDCENILDSCSKVEVDPNSNPWERAEEFFPITGITIENGRVQMDTISK